jgi:hypothetical protein
MTGKDIYVFIDESGDLGERGSKYIVICALWVENPAILERLMKKIRSQKKFKRFLDKTKELHASASSEEFRQYILSELGTNENIHAYAVILEKARVYSLFLKENKHKLYNYVCGYLAANWNISGRHLIIRVDKSKGKALLPDFNSYLETCIKRNGSIISCEIHHSYSHAWHGLQFVDFIAWSIFKKFEDNEPSYFQFVEKKTGIGIVWDKKK